MCIITNKLVFLQNFASSSPIVAPIASPIFEDLCTPSNTKYIRYLSRQVFKVYENGEKSPYPGCQEVRSAPSEFFKSHN